MNPVVEPSLVVEPVETIPGLLVVRLPVHGDNRGWFKENWQRSKMVSLGLPDFGPVQQNISFNAAAGAVRGMHAEPWDKLVSVATGSVFGAWVDLRPGSFGQVFTVRLDPSVAVFVPRGVANGYQVLEDGTAYSYLVNDHWSPAARSSYVFVNVADPALGIDWPLPFGEMSSADQAHPPLSSVAPITLPGTVVLGSSGQVGSALRSVLPSSSVFWDRSSVDLASPASVTGADWSPYSTIVNAAAYTAVDAAETADGRRLAWATNVAGVGALVEVARSRRATLVHVSSDYVFDGSVPEHTEDEPFSPLGVYGQTKAAGDALVSSLRAHYLVRTSWVVGAGKNFVATMARLADSGACPSVVDDQVGRLTFAADIAAAIQHLTSAGSPFGTYNVSCSGPPASWADVAAAVFELRGRSASDVQRVSTESYYASADGPVAPRPPYSTLSLDKITATGFRPRDWREALEEYLAG